MNNIAIYKKEELYENSTIQNFWIVQKGRNKKVARDISHYNIEENIYTLFYQEKKNKKMIYQQLHDQKVLFEFFSKFFLLAVYIANPVLVHELISCVKEWIDSGNGIFVDYSSAKIWVL